MENRKPPNVSGRGPESRFFDELKGQKIRIFWIGQIDPDRGTLLFVDRYSIGVRMQSGVKRLIYKQALASLELDA
jgi:hypothetical protein